ncbi:hypothetical protein FHW96_003854 [Novosphingobium sp. SG751A]|uniref:hypothetical protein n=1 Tax=Novosphingobium sp. SG751A TaxID=2587000 RepID=UPI0020A6BBD7|nr:hypothetical protein [Novosphingobium sp. SG751A]NOW47672.1 hypothetical protein [Novosphingobium sp. SG751A]
MADLAKAAPLQRFSAEGADSDGNLLNVFSAMLRSYNDLADLGSLLGRFFLRLRLPSQRAKTTEN